MSPAASYTFLTSRAMARRSATVTSSGGSMSISTVSGCSRSSTVDDQMWNSIAAWLARNTSVAGSSQMTCRTSLVARCGMASTRIQEGSFGLASFWYQVW